jgi:hypothetical protein
LLFLLFSGFNLPSPDSSGNSLSGITVRKTQALQDLFLFGPAKKKIGDTPLPAAASRKKPAAGFPSSLY